MIGLTLPVLLVFLWKWGVDTKVLPPTLIASPEEVWRKFGVLIEKGVLLNNAKVSLFRLFAGFLLGSFIGISLGIIVGGSKVASKFFEPLLLVLIPVPPLAWIPLLIIAFGIDQGSKIALIAIGSFCTLFLTTSFSVKSTDKNLLELSKLYSKGWYVKLFKITLPYSSSIIFGSLRVAMALSWTLLMAGEMIASSAGLGWFIWDSRSFSRSADMIVGIFTVGIFGWATDRIIVWTGNYVNRWKEEKEEKNFGDKLITIFLIPLKKIWKPFMLVLDAKVINFISNGLSFLFPYKKMNLIHGSTFGIQNPILEINIEEKKYKLNGGELTVLKNLAFEINSGEYLSIIGPSGCGKSTTLKLITGLDTNYVGEIKSHNKKIVETSLNRCLVFQEQRLLFWLKVKDNISFALPTLIKREEKEQKVREVIDIVGLRGFENVFPRQLSGGMQKRVALARAMVNMPEVLLLDEPFGAIDSITKDKMQKELKRILCRTNSTVIMVTHDIDEAIVMSDKIIVLKDKPTSILNTILVNSEDIKGKTSPTFTKIRNELINELYQK